MSSKPKFSRKQTSQSKAESASFKPNQKDFLKEFRNKKVSGSKITHPFAKYSTSGQLQCVICSLQISNDKAWSAHVQTRKHRDTMNTMKRAATKTSNRQSGTQRQVTEDAVSSTVPAKKLKSILKTSHTPPSSPPADSKSATEAVTSSDSTQPQSGLPTDFFDTSPPPTSSTPAPDADTEAHEEGSSNRTESEAKKGEGNMSEVLPEGFFDDPKRDAKVRGVRPEEAMEKEWESFQRLIENDNEQSEMIVAQQDQRDQLERDFSETHQQNRFYTRAEELRTQQETLMSSDRNTPDTGSLSEVIIPRNEDSCSDSEPELDWRAQN